MINPSFSRLCVSMGFIALSLVSNGQPTDSLSAYQNTIRWNVTPMAVIGPRSFVLGYERLMKNETSFSVNLGYLEPKRLKDKNGVPIKVQNKSKSSGMDIAMDYRMYFKKRNKYPAPDGLYWGPYVAYYTWGWKGNTDLVDDGIVVNEIALDSRFRMYNIGIQLGYQFVIKERLALDLILFGPSMTRYSWNLDIDAQTKLNDNSPYYEDIKELFSDLIPGSDILFEKKSINEFGKVDFSFFGFRYGLQIGYRFGKK